MSFSFVACNQEIAKILESLSHASLRTYREEDLELLVGNNDSFGPPPLVLEVPNKNYHQNSKKTTSKSILNSATSLLFPACAAIRTYSSSSPSENSVKTVKRLQILIPDFDGSNGNKNNNNNSSSSSSDDDETDDYNDKNVRGEAKNGFATFDDIPHKITGDDGGRCIVVASSVEELVEFILNKQQDDEEKSGGHQADRDYYWIPNTNNHQESIIMSHDNILLSREEMDSISSHYSSSFVKNRADTNIDDDLQQQQDVNGENDRQVADEQRNEALEEAKKIIRRVNGEIIDAAADAMSTLSLTRLALIYDDVESRREKIMRTRTTGKDVKTVVVPVVDDDGEDDGEVKKLIKIGFTS